MRVFCTYFYSSFGSIATVLQRTHEVLSLSLNSGDMIIPSVQIGLLGSITAIIQHQRTESPAGIYIYVEAYTEEREFKELSHTERMFNVFFSLITKMHMFNHSVEGVLKLHLVLFIVCVNIKGSGRVHICTLYAEPLLLHLLKAPFLHVSSSSSKMF